MPPSGAGRPTLRIAFDIGGTFTDFVLEDGRAGTLLFHKVPTTPRDPALAVIAGLDELLTRCRRVDGSLGIEG